MKTSRSMYTLWKGEVPPPSHCDPRGEKGWTPPPEWLVPDSPTSVDGSNLDWLGQFGHIKRCPSLLRERTEQTARKLRQVHRQTCCEYSGVLCLVIALVLFSVCLNGFWVGITLVLLIFFGCDYPCFCLFSWVVITLVLFMIWGLSPRCK